MGTPRFWYYPAGYINNATAEEIDVGSGIRALEEEPDPQVVDTRTLGGRIYTVHRGDSMRVKIVHERFTGDALYRKLATMINHLDRGGTVAFSADVAKAFAAYTEGPRFRGSTSFFTNGNTWDWDSTSVSLASGDEMVIETPGGVREFSTLSSYSTTTQKVTLASGLVFDHDAPYMLIRHRNYFPALRRPAGDRRNPLTTERRIVHTLDLDLVVDWTTLTSFSGFAEGMMLGTSGGNERQITIATSDQIAPSSGGILGRF